MGLRENLAANLSRLVKTRGSIAFVARQLGISRQQLGHYLDGKHIPNDATLRKLCRYFRITEDYLFNADPADSPETSLDPTCIGIIERLQSGRTSLEAGQYATYFWGERFPDKVVGALTVVRKDGDATTFRRITASIERRPNSRWSYVRGDHQGVVSENLNWIFFQGANRIPPHEPTLLALQWAVSPSPVLVGHGMVITAAGPESIRVAMRPSPFTPLRKALQLSRVYSTDDNELDGFIIGTLKQSI